MTGGADPLLDEMTASPPTSEAFREGVSIWVWDNDGHFFFPRIGVEAVGATWTRSYDTALCMADPKGGLVLAFGPYPPLDVMDARGRPRVLGAGPLRFECLTPFELWRVRFDGRAVIADVDGYLRGGEPKPLPGCGHPELNMRVSIDAVSAAPPWFQGTHEPDGHHVPGERRFEQLCEVEGTVELEGEPPVSFRGGALRVHRKGGDRNNYGDFYGHCWQSALFPSGRAFGFIHYRSGPDGAPRYREGWVREGDQVRSARVDGTPWLEDVRHAGEDVSFTLETGESIRIAGVTVASSIRPPRHTDVGTTFPVLHSGIARYRWQDEESFGMIERSAPLDL
jgi:hypothetical protein